jgi:hypothetical protein
MWFCWCTRGIGNSINFYTAQTIEMFPCHSSHMIISPNEVRTILECFWSDPCRVLHETASHANGMRAWITNSNVRASRISKTGLQLRIDRTCYLQVCLNYVTSNSASNLYKFRIVFMIWEFGLLGDVQNAPTSITYFILDFIHLQFKF